MAVVASGSLCCCGSPLFLRRRLGSGYYLTLVKSPQSRNIQGSKVRVRTGPRALSPALSFRNGTLSFSMKGNSGKSRQEQKPDSEGSMAG